MLEQDGTGGGVPRCLAIISPSPIPGAAPGAAGWSAHDAALGLACIAADGQVDVVARAAISCHVHVAPHLWHGRIRITV